MTRNPCLNLCITLMTRACGKKTLSLLNSSSVHGPFLFVKGGPNYQAGVQKKIGTVVIGFNFAFSSFGFGTDNTKIYNSVTLHACAHAYCKKISIPNIIPIILYMKVHHIKHCEQSNHSCTDNHIHFTHRVCKEAPVAGVIGEAEAPTLQEYDPLG